MNSNNSRLVPLRKDVLIKVIEAYERGDFLKHLELIPELLLLEKGNVFQGSREEWNAVIRDKIKVILGFSLESNLEDKALSFYAKEALLREKPEENPLTVSDQTCAKCSTKIYVTDLCKGCLARPCQSACRFKAISMVNNRSKIDNDRCKSCKMCINVCPYNAIVKTIVPCEEACPVGAIKKDERKRTTIDFDRCIACGRCISVCPFSAIEEKSQIIDILKWMKLERKLVVAMFAPSLVGQFPGTIYQLKSALLKAGFSDVFEVAQGANVTTLNEAKEFEARMSEQAPFMTTSCCAGYNQLVKKHLPELKEFVSHTLTPLYYTAEIVKKKYPEAIKVFISPCVAKRKEVIESQEIDYVLTYAELEGLFIAKKIKVDECEEGKFKEPSSKQARNFGVTTGVSSAVKSVLKDPELVKPYIIDGVTKDTVKALKTMALNKKCLEGNLIEVMCCAGGCVGGNATICPTREVKKQLKTLLDQSNDLKRE